MFLSGLREAQKAKRRRNDGRYIHTITHSITPNSHYTTTT
jgi:hypothetical protein